MRRLRLRRLRFLPLPELLLESPLAALLAGAIWVNFAISFTSLVWLVCPTSPTMAPLIKQALQGHEKGLTGEETRPIWTGAAPCSTSFACRRFPKVHLTRGGCSVVLSFRNHST